MGYSAQVNLLKKSLYKVGESVSVTIPNMTVGKYQKGDPVRVAVNPQFPQHIEVKTVDGFQGREKDVIIFSCVRCFNTLGFLTDHRRLNVALTRAKKALIVVGCGNLLRQDPTWASWIKFVEVNGLSLQF